MAAPLPAEFAVTPPSEPAAPLPPDLAAPLPSELANPLAPFCSARPGPGPGPFLAVSAEGIRAVAEHLGLSPGQAMILCLGHDIWPLRFARNRGVFSAEEQIRLLRSRAAVIGCGGLGGHVVTLLARAGVGAFTLCDPDSFDESNGNRQLLCREANIGRNKALVAQEELAAIASHAEARVFPVAAGPANLPDILHKADIVMDCLDSLETRRSVAAAADAAAIPFVHGAGAGEEGFAMLLRPGEKGLDSLYGTEVSHEETNAESRLGVPTLTPAAIAVLQANIALRVLTG